MKNLGMKTAIAALTVAFAGEAIATEWNVLYGASVGRLPSMLRNWQNWSRRKPMANSR